MTEQTPPEACPFCGKVPPKTIHETRFGEGYLQCACCEARGPTSFADALTAWNTRASADARLVEALRQIKHSIGQARILGNDWKRELALIENLTDAALSGVSQ